ncbi:MAG: hypothetical protein AAGM21_05140 [Pseudomonadota bacterium]
MNVIQALFALAALAGFLLVMLLHVPILDLTIVILITFAFAAYDFYTSLKRK